MTRRKRADACHRAAPRAHARAFTLIEVLVALVIVTLGMAALMSSLSSAADGAAYLRDKSFAQWVALDQIALARLQQQAPSLGDTTGEVELANRKWTWKQTVSNLEVQGIIRIDVSVRPSDIPAPKSGQDGGWFVTVSGVRGDAVAVGNVTVAYGDITTACETVGQTNANAQDPYGSSAGPAGTACASGAGALTSGSGTTGAGTTTGTTGSGTTGSRTGTGTSGAGSNGSSGSSSGASSGGSNAGGSNPGFGSQ